MTQLSFNYHPDKSTIEATALLDHQMRERCELTHGGERAGYFDTKGNRLLIVTGQHLVESGLWERFPDPQFNGHRFFRPKQKGSGQ